MTLRVAVAIAVLVTVFGFALPRIAGYGEAWDAVSAMTGGQIFVLALVSTWNLATYWPVLVLAQPGLRLREAAVVNQASTAVTNTVPAGSAVAVGVTFRMLRAWGFSTESITNQTVLTGVWNQLVKLGMPVLALVAVAATGEIEGTFLRLTSWGVAGIVVVVAAGVIVLRAERSTARVGAALDRAAATVLGWLGRARPTAVGAWLVRVRAQMIVLVRTRALALSLAAIVSHLSLYAVLLVSIRAMGISASELSWSRILMGFALVRLLSAIPLTPGGVGVVELGYVAFLATGTADGLEGAVAAAVLLFRAITYVLPVLLGGVAWIVFQRAEDWRRPAGSRDTLHFDRATVAA